MSDPWIAFLSAIAGGLIAGGASVATTWIQQRNQRRAELVKVAYQAALEDYRDASERMKRRAAEGVAVRMPPLLSYVFHHVEAIDLIDRGKLTPETAADLIEKEGRISAVLPRSPNDPERQR